MKSNDYSLKRPDRIISSEKDETGKEIIVVKYETYEEVSDANKHE